MENEFGKELITIEKEVYDKLVNAFSMLKCLVDAGVDNWDVYDDAMELYESDECPKLFSQ
jgi:hypothetical protein